MAIETPYTTVRGGVLEPPQVRGAKPAASPAAASDLAAPRQEAAKVGRPGEAARGGEDGTVAEAVTRIQDFVQTMRRELQFQVDEDSGQTVVRVVDRETNEVIRQIPPEEVLEVSRRLRALADGLLLRERA